jgi:hypothetical protein
VLLAVYSGNDPFAFNPNAFTRYVVDITSIVGGGGTFDLRFAEVNNQLWMHQGIDNVSIKFTGIADNPEPMTLAMWSALAGVGGVVAYRKRRAGK